MSASDWVLIIGAVFGGAVLVINAFGTYWGRREAKVAASEAKEERAVADKKLDEIHILTNNNMSELKNDLATATARIKTLETLLLSFTQQRRQSDDGNRDAQ